MLFKLGLDIYRPKRDGEEEVKEDGCAEWGMMKLELGICSDEVKCECGHATRRSTIATVCCMYGCKGAKK